MKSIPAHKSTAKSGQRMPVSLGHVDGVIENAIAVRKFGPQASVVARIRAERRYAALEASGALTPRGPISGGVTIPAATAQATRSMARLAALIAAGAANAAGPVVEQAKGVTGFVKRLAAKFGLNKKGHAA